MQGWGFAVWGVGLKGFRCVLFRVYIWECEIERSQVEFQPATGSVAGLHEKANIVRIHNEL